MTNELPADDLIPIIAKLSMTERRRLMRLVAFGSQTKDAELYSSQPLRENEFTSDEDPLSWDADGWEDINEHDD
jgi:hypothetical protein